ncbi:hypothetical protein EZV62_004188 [Acer yangbiense]|uniref:Retrovirus-related Pol polyprotein from transposon TNT 1-94-like beta-barrel domain-containing protein n=1 Tax=Acer yangbiense TaxID=1000413 RepID=A0A5C7IJ06_9ROSI|nr:hypothetical protein EZV62_004188 [Acer yangbiense]
MSTTSQQQSTLAPSSSSTATPTVLQEGSNSSNESSPFGNKLNQSFAIKLDRQNFILWKTMVTTIIKGHRLDGHLYSTRPCPPEFLPSPTTPGVPSPTTPGVSDSGSCSNPEYEKWLVNDQLLMGWLYSSMTENVALSVMGSTTAAGLWKALENLFGAYSKSKANTIRTSIQTTRKGSSTMEEYLTQMKTWADSLAIAGDPYPENLLFANSLAGLDSEYMPIVVLIEAREHFTWQEIYDTLLSYDSKLEHINNVSAKGNLLSSPSAHLATNKPNNTPNTNKTSNQQNLNQGGNRAPNRGGFRGGGGRFRGRGGRNNNSRPTCQVCGKFGHSASVCYFRYDDNYMGSVPTANSNANSPSVFVATPETVDDTTWYADSGATNHVTNDAGNLDLKSDYRGDESLMVGNGKQLDISHVGLKSLPSLTKHSIILKQVLHVPEIRKNLLSVSRLVNDNDVFIEFHANCCFVKDKLTGMEVLRGRLKNGLYQLEIPTTKSAFNIQPGPTKSRSSTAHFFGLPLLSSNESKIESLSVETQSQVKSSNSKKNVWHRRLGHPSNQVLNQPASVTPNHITSWFSLSNHSTLPTDTKTPSPVSSPGIDNQLLSPAASSKTGSESQSCQQEAIHENCHEQVHHSLEVEPSLDIENVSEETVLPSQPAIGHPMITRSKDGIFKPKVPPKANSKSEDHTNYGGFNN